MHHNQRNGVCQFNTIIPVRNAIQAVCHRSIKTQQFCGLFPIDVVSCSCQSTAAQRTNIHSLFGVVQSAQIPQQHLYICQQMMCKCHRLCTLQMGIARHYRFGVLFRNIHQCFAEFPHQCPNFCDFCPQIQPQVQCNLVISRTRSM